MSQSIVVQIRREDGSLLNELIEAQPEDVRLLESRGLDGSDIMSALIHLTTVTLPLVTTLLVTLIRARSHVSVKIDGVELTGLSEKNAKGLLSQAMNARGASPPTQPKRPQQPRHIKPGGRRR